MLLVVLWLVFRMMGEGVANRSAPGLVLREGDLEVLGSWLRATTVPAGLARRARIVLLAAQGVANSRIAQAVGVSVPTVVSWRRRYQAGGVRGLEDAPRSGRPSLFNGLCKPLWKD